MKTESGLLLPHGVYKRHSRTEQSPNAIITDEERLRITRERNSSNYFNKVFLNPHLDRSLLFQDIPRERGGGVVHTLMQLQPWETGAAMITVATQDIVDNNVEKDEHGRVPVQFVYDREQGYNPDLQREYHTGILRLMQAMTETKLPGEKTPDDMPPVVAMENAVSTLGRGRTLALQHAVVVKTGMPVDTDSKPKFAHSHNLEQRLKKSYPGAEEFVDTIARGMNSDLAEFGINLKFSLRRDKKPYGHTIETPIEECGDLEQDGGVLAAIMYSHFTVAGEAQEKQHAGLNGLGDKLRARGLIEPYAFRHYFYFKPNEDGVNKLHITASYALLGGAAKEDAGGELDRNPAYPKQIPDAEEVSYVQRLKASLTK